MSLAQLVWATLEEQFGPELLAPGTFLEQGVEIMTWDTGRSYAEIRIHDDRVGWRARCRTLHIDAHSDPAPFKALDFALIQVLARQFRPVALSDGCRVRVYLPATAAGAITVLGIVRGVTVIQGARHYVVEGDFKTPAYPYPCALFAEHHVAVVAVAG